jgi:hypothetical protein
LSSLNFLEKDDKEKKAAIKQAEETFFNKYSGELSLFKRNLFASPYLKVFKTYVAGMKFLLPDTQENLKLRPSPTVPVITRESSSFPSVTPYLSNLK